MKPLSFCCMSANIDLTVRLRNGIVTTLTSFQNPKRKTPTSLSGPPVAADHWGNLGPELGPGSESAAAYRYRQVKGFVVVVEKWTRSRVEHNRSRANRRTGVT